MEEKKNWRTPIKLSADESNVLIRREEMKCGKPLVIGVKQIMKGTLVVIRCNKCRVADTWIVRNAVQHCWKNGETCIGMERKRRFSVAEIKVDAKT